MTGDTTSLRDLLTRVASGEIDPAEAARLLDEDPTVPTIDRTSVPTSTVGVVIKAGGVKLTVLHDPGVDTAYVEGPHALHEEGGTLVIEMPSGEGYRTTDAPRFLGWVPSVWTGGRGEKVTVRINPELPLTIEATACAVEVVGHSAPLALRCTSSSIKIRGHRGTVTGSVTMSSLDVDGLLTGPGSLVCELGSVNLRMLPGSDLALRTTGELSSIKINGEKTDLGFDAEGRHTRIGAGSTPYDLSVRMGSATVVAA